MRLARYARVVLLSLAAVAMLGTAVLLSACAPAATSSAPAPVESQSATPPTVTLVEPAEGASVASGDVRVVVETTGLKFVNPSNTVVAGEGHVHFTLDDKPFQMSTSPEYVMKAVAPGPHVLKAELVQNDTRSFDPPVKQEIGFTAN
ncbi:MAG TPA: hypothetical protein VF902_02825 [Coriobacteriia bacterium]